MGAVLNIQIRVLATQAQRQIQQMRAQILQLQRALAQANAAQNGAAGSAGRLGAAQNGAAAAANTHSAALMRLGMSAMNSGKKMQWFGRQISYNLSLPLIVAGVAAFKWEMQSDKALTRMKKVYGSAGKGAKEYGNEIKALDRHFDALSDKFGVARADVKNIAADWAAVGLSGAALARGVGATLETMILGELSATKATEGLVSIQAQWGLSSKGVAKAIDVLNMAENESATSMSGLLAGFQRVGSLAKGAGISIEELAAMFTGLTPTAGTATQAGNGIKSILTTLNVQTPKVAAAFRMMNIDVKSSSWQNMKATDQLKLMAKGYVGLTDNQRKYFSGMVAGKWQTNKMTALMVSMASKNGIYNKIINATADAQHNATQRTRELNAVLESDSQRVKIYGNILKNELTDAMVEIVPIVIKVIKYIVHLAKKFNDMSDGTKKFALFALVAIAILGPVLSMLGSLVTIAGGVIWALGAMGTGFAAVGRGAKIAAVWIWRQIAALSASRAATAAWAVTVLAWNKIVWLSYQAWVIAVAVANAAIVVAQFAASAAWAGIVLAWNAIVLEAYAGWPTVIAAVGKTVAAVQAVSSAVWAGIVLAWNAIVLQAYMGFPAVIAAVGATVAAVQAVASATWAAIYLTARNAVIIAMLELPAIVAAVGRATAAIQVAMSATWAAIVITANAVAAGAFMSLPVVVAAVGAAINAIAAITFFGWPIAAVAAIGLVIAATWMMRDHIWNALKQIPGIFVTVFQAVVNTIAAAAKAVYEWFSYLNPFATHSPSLVDNVKAGMDVIVAQYSRASGMTALFRKTANDLAAFGKIAQVLDRKQSNKDRKQVAKYTPANMGVYNKLSSDLKSLNALMDSQSSKITKQTSVVASWSAKLDKANVSLDRQQEKLTGLQDRLSGLQGEYDKHKDKMQEFADTSITGMGAMDDAIFENTLAQKKLQLQILKYEQVNGSIDDVRDNMSKLAGDIESLKGEAGDLRASGAGSDVLGPINAQIDQMSVAYKKMGEAAGTSPETGMKKQLNDLQKQGEILDLTKDITFDPMVRQIDKLVNKQKELSYDQIVAGINKEKAAMEALVPQIDKVTAQIDKQQKVVDNLTKARDELQKRYDLENAKLEKQQVIFDRIKGSIDAVTDALGRLLEHSGDIKVIVERKAEVKKAAADAKKAKVAAVKVAKAKVGDGLPKALGKPTAIKNAPLGREGGAADQAKQIDAMTKALEDELAKSMGSIKIPSMGEIFKGMFKGMWNGIKTGYLWLGENLYYGYQILWNDYIKKGISWLWDNWTGGMAIIGDWLKKTWNDVTGYIGYRLLHLFDPIGDIITTVVGWFQWLYERLVGGSIIPDLVNGIGDWIKKLWTNFTGWISKLVKDVIDFFGSMASGVKSWWTGTFLPFLTSIGTWLLDTGKGFLSFFFKLPGKALVFFTELKTKITTWWTSSFLPLLTSIGTWLLDTGKGFLSFFFKLPGRILAYFNDVKTKVSTWWTVTFLPFLTSIGIWLLDTGKGFLSFFFKLPGRILAYFANVKTKVTAWWDSIAKPWFTAVGSWFTSTEGFMKHPSQIGNKILGFFGAVKTKVGEFWNDKLKPYLSNIGAWFTSEDGFLRSIKNLPDKMAGIFKKIPDKIKDALNMGIDAINGLIDKVNKMAGKIGIKLDFGQIPKMAQGGQVPNQRVGSGFKTNRARAIVGEGSNQYPEYVIPTDPRYRDRAKGLYQQLGNNLDGPQMMASGGIVAFGRWIESLNQGYIVGEHPSFGTGRVGTHSPGSLHYSGDAIDVNRGAGTSTLEQQYLSKLLDPAHKAGLRTIFMTKDHYNHMHIDTGRGGSLGGGVGGAIGSVINKARDLVAEGIGSAVSTMEKALPDVTVVRSIAGGFKDKLVDWIKGKATEADSTVSGDTASSDRRVGAGVEQWRGVALNALVAAGQPTSWIDSLLSRMQQESGGNPTIVNKWDSNWKAGTPSVGLMQVIGPTFKANAGPYKNTGPFSYGTSTDPMANIYASIKYTVGRYGSGPAGWDRPGGYESGGILNPIALAKGGVVTKPVIAQVGEKGKEVVMPLKAFESSIKNLSKKAADAAWDAREAAAAKAQKDLTASIAKEAAAAAAAKVAAAAAKTAAAATAAGKAAAAEAKSRAENLASVMKQYGTTTQAATIAAIQANDAKIAAERAAAAKKAADTAAAVKEAADGTQAVVDIIDTGSFDNSSSGFNSGSVTNITNIDVDFSEVTAAVTRIAESIAGMQGALLTSLSTINTSLTSGQIQVGVYMGVSQLVALNTTMSSVVQDRMLQVSLKRAATAAPGASASSVAPNLGGGGGTTVIIQGDLSFPNITDPADAEQFINNLKGLG